VNPPPIGPVARLRDSSDAGAAQAARLLRSQPALTSTQQRKARNWQHIEHRVSTRARPRPFFRRPLLAASLLLLTAGGAIAAGATSFGWWRGATSPGDIPAHTVSPRRVPPPVVVPLAPQAAPAEPAKGPPAALQPARRPARASTPTAPLAAGPAAQPSASESKLLLDAIRALRRAHDPARARSLSLIYLRLHPRGVLAEDALALLVQAEAALSSPNLRARAQRYLLLYPQGRFRARVEALLQQHEGPATTPTP
jgi:hypothetical protein